MCLGPECFYAQYNVECEHRVQIRVKCNEDDTIGDLKKLVAAQTGESHTTNGKMNA